jgi:predicted glycogen debranching enzyme
MPEADDFNLIAWLKSQRDYNFDIPLIDTDDAQAQDDREWLVTNGLGSYASANIWGANTRRYHGLLVAALNPPVNRHVLLSRLDEIVDGQSLSTNFWESGSVTPTGYTYISAFTIYPCPTWAFKLKEGFLLKQVFMLPDKQETIICYHNQGHLPMALTVQVLVNFRDYHSQTRGSEQWQFLQEVMSDRVIIKAYETAQQLVFAFSQGNYQRQYNWYWNYYWPQEHERGLECNEDNYHAGTLTVNLAPGAHLTIKAGLDSRLAVGTFQNNFQQLVSHQESLLNGAGQSNCPDLQRLILSADNFIVQRSSTAGYSIIAGYHWFADWGRDSMISLPGLTLSNGRSDIARSILETFGQYLSEGMLPNTFPDSGMTPQYNTIDATLWWAWALYKYYQACSDLPFIKEQLTLLDEVVNWHLKGTRYGIHVDPEDALLTGGEANVQLTWMDAKVGDYVVTPRSGKAVEINALWFNFLKILEYLHGTIGSTRQDYGALAEKTRTGFAKFWNGQLGCLYDVITEDGSCDASVRPNQLLALSLPFELLTRDQAASVLAAVEKVLLTPVGLRSLSCEDENYKGQYGDGKEVANQYFRDITYHQGTAWPWLLGAWVDARMRLYGDDKQNVTAIANGLRPIRKHILAAAGLGNISEIFDGNSPYRARGCIAQAWSVAEIIRVLSQYPLIR